MRLFNEDHMKFRQRVRDFVEKEVNPYADEMAQNRQIPRSLWKKMGEAGFLGFCYGKDYGGRDLDVVYSLILTEELSKSRCRGIAPTVATHNEMASPYINRFGTHEQRTKYLTPCTTGDAICAIAVTEPDAGSDVAAMNATAVKDGDHYVINGQKIYITNGYYADIIITAAKTDTKIRPAFKGVSLFIVERGTKGLSASKLDKMGIPASDTAEVVYQDCRVPAENLIGSEGEGFKYIMQCFQRERLMVTLFSLASCEKVIEETIDFCRNTSEAGTPLISLQGNKHKLVQVVTELEMTKTFTYDCCQEYLEGNDIIKRISMAKYVAGELVNKVARISMGLQGEHGYLNNNVAATVCLDARPNIIAGGSTEIMKEIVAKELGF
jgi:acyl-CoA dehydrogenase